MTPQPNAAWAWANLFPITAVVAICLFLAREVLEHRRRGQSKQRQIEALKLILGRECVYNHWPLQQLTEIVEFLQAGEQNYKKLKITKRPNGPAAFMEDDDGGGVGYKLADFTTGRMSDMLLQVAELDAKLFRLVEAAYDALADAESVKSQLVNGHALATGEGPDSLVAQLAAYWDGSIVESNAALQALYFHCAGKKLEDGRYK
jgi:hypothetical protein